MVSVTYLGIRLEPMFQTTIDPESRIPQRLAHLISEGHFEHPDDVVLISEILHALPQRRRLGPRHRSQSVPIRAETSGEPERNNKESCNGNAHRNKKPSHPTVMMEGD